MSFYGGTFTDYCKYCDDKYSGIFKLKKGEDAVTKEQFEKIRVGDEVML